MALTLVLNLIPDLEYCSWSGKPPSWGDRSPVSNEYRPPAIVQAEPDVFGANPILMKKLSTLAFVVAFPLAAVLSASAQEGTPPAAPSDAAGKEGEKPFANAVLEQALNNMAKLGSYHVRLEITTGEGKSILEGDLGTGTLDFKGTDAKGVRKRRIVVGGEFFLSLDKGETWKTGEEADRDGTIFLSQVVTGPVTPELKIWEKGTFQAEEVTLDGEALLKVEKPAQGKEPAVTFWIAREAQLENAVFIRRASLIIDSQVGDLPVTVIYTKLNEPVKIEAPIAKK